MNPAPAATGAAASLTWWQQFRFKIFILLGGTILFVIIEIPESLNVPMEEVMAIKPRSPRHLIGVPLHPFLHYGWSHLLSNLFGWWLLGGLLLLGDGIFLFAFLFWWVALIAGMLTWCASPRNNTFHAGLSGVLFGMFAFLAFRVWWERPLNFKNIAIFLVAAFLYGLSILLSLFKFKSNISWELHLFGVVAGLLMAYLFFKVKAFKFLENKLKGEQPASQQANPLASSPPTQAPAAAAAAAPVPAAPVNPFAAASAPPAPTAPPSNPFAPGGAYASRPEGPGSKTFTSAYV